MILRILFLLLLTLPCLGAVRTATVSGDWNNTATWGGNPVPVAGDTANIQGDVTVTIPVGVDAEISQLLMPTSNNTNFVATLVVNGTIKTSPSGQFIAIGAGASRDGKLIVGPGSTITVSNNLYMRNGYFESTATKASPAVIDGPGNIGNATVTHPRQDINITNVSFRNTGDITFFVQDDTGLSAGSGRCFVSNCVFAGNRSVTFGKTNTLASIPISVGHCDFRDFGTTRTVVVGRTNGGSARFGFYHNTLFQTVSGANVMQLRPSFSTGLVVEGNVFDNAQIQEQAPGGSIITNNFMTSRQNSQGFTQFHNSNAVSIVRNYIRPSANNANGLSTTGTMGTDGGTNKIIDNVLEGMVDGGTFTGRPDFFLPNATPLSSDVLGNLVCGAGETAVGANTPNWQTLNVKRNTLAVTVPSSADAGGSLWICESTASSGTINYANNLARGNGGAGAIVIGGSSSGAAQVIAYSDYNCFTNNANDYQSSAQLTITAGNTGKTVPGSFDIRRLPRFFSETRTLAKWNLYFGSGTDSGPDGITYLLGINGYRGTPNFDQNGTASSNEPWHLLDWVRRGFKATNPALRAAGDPNDGSPDIGIGYTASLGKLSGFF